MDRGPEMSGNRASLRNSSRKSMPARRYFTIGDVADFLVVSTRTVGRWIADGKLPVHRFGGLVRIAEDDFAAFLATHRRRNEMSAAVCQGAQMSGLLGSSGRLRSNKRPIYSRLEFPNVTACRFRSGHGAGCP